LGEVCTSILAGGSTPKNCVKGRLYPTKEFPYPVFSNATEAKGLYGYSDSYTIESDAVTISAHGTLGYHTVREGKFTAAVGLIVLIPNKSIISTKYLNYILDMTPIRGTGSCILHLYVSMVKKIRIPIPPLAIQNEIVRILDKFTDITEELTAELFARKKQYEYYRDKLLTFEDGDVEWKSLKEIAIIGTGSRNTNEATIDGKYPFFVRSEKPKLIDDFDFDETAIITAGDGGVGKVFHYISGKYALHQRAYRIVVLDKDINSKFVFHYIRSNFAHYLKKVSVHATVASLRKPMFEKYLIPIPCPDNPQKSLEIQNEIVRILDKFDTLTNSISEGLPHEIALRQKQYEYYRDMLLRFPKEDRP